MDQNKNIYDTIIIGGGAAGLSATMVLARAHYKVAIIDNGKQSNLASSAAHAVFTRDNTDPRELYKIAKNQLAAYPTVNFINGRVVTANKNNSIFKIQLEDGPELTSNTVILAQGVNYHLPEVPGLKELWGKKVWHCPYCHGYESTGKNILAIMESSRIDHMKHLLPKWKIEATYAEPSKISEIIDTEDGVLAIFKDGSKSKFDEILAQTHHQQHDNLPEQLGCHVNENGVLIVDNMHMTNIDGVYSAGDQSSSMQQVNLAAAAGHLAAVAITQRKGL